MNSIFILHYEKDQNQRIQLRGNKGIRHSAQQEIKKKCKSKCHLTNFNGTFEPENELMQIFKNQSKPKSNQSSTNSTKLGTRSISTPSYLPQLILEDTESSDVQHTKSST